MIYGVYRKNLRYHVYLATHLNATLHVESSFQCDNFIAQNINIESLHTFTD